MANIILKCPVCETVLKDDICPQCGYVHLYFPTSVPKAIDDFQKRRVEVLKEVTKRHSDQLDEAHRDITAARQQAERLRADLGRANDTVRNQKIELDAKDKELEIQDERFRIELDQAKSTINNQKNQLNAKERELNSQTGKFQIELGRAEDVIRKQKVDLDAKDRTLVQMTKEMEELKRKLREAERKGSAPQISFDYNKNQGIGVASQKDGSVYAGQWVDGKLQGRGTLFFPNGECMTALFEKGRMLDAVAIWYFPDHSFVQGHMTSKGPTGLCFHTMTDGTIIEEYWIDGKIIDA